MAHKKHEPAPLPDRSAFLPVTRADAAARGWNEVDFVFVSGDAYVDHPSFGMAILTRLLEAHGYSVGIIAQPDWHDPASIDVFGRPRLAFLVSAGAMDSMVNHYTVAKRRRRYDYYSPGGEMGLRPDHAAVVYGNLIRRTYKDVPIVLGGIEASLRRLAHYDYWQDKLKRSILLDSGADLISYGMGEKSIVAIAEALDAGLSVADLTFIPGTVYRCRSIDHCDRPVMLPSWEELEADKLNYARSFGVQYRNLDPFSARTLVEEYPHGVYVVQNPPSEPLSTPEFDELYRFPYTRTWHPDYAAAGGIPALAEVKFSLTSNRGCLGDCAFCSLNFHQGRIIQARSRESIVAEAKEMIRDPDFKGYIHDVGGPTANFRVPACAKQAKHGACPTKRCLSPEPCSKLTVTHEDYVELLRELRALPGVKKVFIRSGIRFDYVLLDPDPTFFHELVRYHVSGQLRLAPEHVSDTVLKVMGKPSNAVYERFVDAFNDYTREIGKEQYVLPYLMSSHPGSTMKEAVELAEFCRDLGFNPEQVSDFYPTPSTISTCIYYTGVDPRTMEAVYCPRSPHEKAMQRALIQYRNPKNRPLVREALMAAHREDLIGYGPKCLVKPEKGESRPHAGDKAKRGGASNGRRPAQEGRSRKGANGRSGASARARGAHGKDNRTNGAAGTRGKGGTKRAGTRTQSGRGTTGASAR
ncbi:MAG: YgiQ family radical SAM protein [Eggerthellaceae bacterium]|jgi:uncharacterized radical SAM protein YgiQ|nr:YgiQ family radical SAM protein [Eggerthellaceae bacterium]